MSARTLTRITCDHPACSSVAECEGGPLDNHRPPGWATASSTGFRMLWACPAHAAELVAAEKTLHEYAVRECNARNAWATANPAPKVPAWLKNIHVG